MSYRCDKHNWSGWEMCPQCTFTTTGTNVQPLSEHEYALYGIDADKIIQPMSKLQELVAKWRERAKLTDKDAMEHRMCGWRDNEMRSDAKATMLYQLADELEAALREEPAGTLPRVIAAPVPLKIGSQFTIQQGNETFYAEVIPKKTLDDDSQE